MRNVSAADANRHFSRILREVQSGELVTITSRGQPVATIAPVDRATSRPGDAMHLLLARLKAQAPVGATWRRDELYE